MTTVKEARAKAIEVLTPFFNDAESGGQFNFEADYFKRLSKKVESALMPYYEKVKDQVSLSDFTNQVILDIQYDFVGGAIAKLGSGDIEIEIK
ncbi:MAG: hypothetical protein PHS34_08700 [Candidatus Omnitrophica bacterium]|nr:hypothetical protein [Candidatus Omnitrophota bacterium]